MRAVSIIIGTSDSSRTRDKPHSVQPATSIQYDQVGLPETTLAARHGTRYAETILLEHPARSMTAIRHPRQDFVALAVADNSIVISLPFLSFYLMENR